MIRRNGDNRLEWGERIGCSENGVGGRVRRVRGGLGKEVGSQQTGEGRRVDRVEWKRMSSWGIGEGGLEVRGERWMGVGEGG